MILAFNGEAEQATELAQGLAQRSPHFDLAAAAHAYALACAGRAEEARVILERLQWLGRERFLLARLHARGLCRAGRPRSRPGRIARLNEARCPWFFQMLADPRLKPLHGNPEFERMRAILPAMEAEVEQDLQMED